MDHLDAITEFNLTSMGLLFLSQSRRVQSEAVYTLEEAATLASCTTKTIQNAINARHLNAGYVGRCPRILGADLLLWIKDGGKTGRTKGRY